MPLHNSNIATISQATFYCLNSMGFDAVDMFQRSGLDSARIRDSDARFTGQQLNRLWRIAIEETKRPCLVYDVVDYIEPWMLHALGHGWISSHTLLSGLERFERYHRMLSTNADVKLEQMQGAWQLRANFRDPENSPSTDALVVLALYMCREAFGEDLIPLQVQLVRSKPEDANSVEDFFRCDIEYGYSENTLVFSTSDLNRKLRTANPAVAQAMDDVVVSYLTQFDSQDTVSRVRQVVAKYLVHGEPDKQIIANELNLAPRTLQRRLEKQHSSVKEIIDETRHQLALDYLNRKHLSIKEIAFGLGFSDPSNFSRAFKRWEGKTPKEYRNSSAESLDKV